MNVIRLSANNVKVAFSEAELEKYGLDISAPCGECCAACGTVKRILEAVKSESGVDYCGERVYIRVVRARDGGCDMIISRLGKGEITDRPDGVLCFRTVGALIAACRTMDKSIRSDAYIGENGAYLIIGGADLRRCTSCGERLLFAFAEAYVREHCRPITCGDAVEVLGRL